MSRPKKIVSLSIVILFLAAFAYVGIRARNHGFSAREQPTWYEKWLARNARRIATPSDARSLTNPIRVTGTTLEEASEHFGEHCAICHGVNGRGKTEIGENLYPKAADLTAADTQGLPDGELFYIVSNGVRFTGMPAMSGEDSRDSIWALVAYIRHLPQLSLEELKRVEQSQHDHDEGSTGATGEQSDTAEHPKPPPNLHRQGAH